METQNGNDKRELFLKELKELLVKFDAEISIEDFGTAYSINDKIVVDFNWDEELYEKTNSGIIEQLILGTHVFGN